MMDGLWDQPGVPHKGWHCIGCTDLESAIGQCQMCGKEDIRYVHHMEHPNYSDTLDCGCVCAEKMEDNSFAPHKREQAMKNKAARRKRWLSRKWRISRNGNPYLNVQSHNVVVFCHKKGYSTGKWGYSIAGEYSKQSFSNSDEAKLAAFERLWVLISS
jgi:hypothetical protein